MKRRQAIQQILTIAAGTALFPACKMDSYPVYMNVPIEKKQRKLLDQFCNAILPISNENIIIPEAKVDFLLTMLNDVYAPKDIQKFLSGLDEFKMYLEENHRKSFKRMEAEEKEKVLEFLAGAEGPEEPLPYFYKTTRSLMIRQFTSTEYYMKNILEFEFAPGRYVGCVEV